VLIGITALIQAPALVSKLPYDTFRDFIPVAQIASSADLFVVPPSLPANSLREFVEHAKANPKKLNFGSYGNGTSSHIHGEMLNLQAGVDLAHVSYKGAAPLINDMLGGQLSSAFIDFGSARGQINSGKFRILAITGAARSKALPHIPTFTELGYKGYEPYGWFGVFLPAGTPKEIVARLSAEFVRIIKSPEMAARIEDMGLRVDGIGAQEFAEIVKTDAAQWAKVIKDAQIRVE
jgi:tripartite-type tricarboxylate transporter receptor subunit TctC